MSGIEGKPGSKREYTLKHNAYTLETALKPPTQEGGLNYSGDC